MSKPALIVLAAGLGSRFGGLKQITPVDEEGHVIMDFSVFDAKKAGFEKIVFVIKPEIEADFRERVGKRIEKHMDVRYAYQLLTMLPGGVRVPKGREKPWGTAHAMLCASKHIDGPFAVINADDFYGATAFQQLYDFLENESRDDLYAMVGYRIENTLTENGSVARGVCTVADGKLVGIVERTQIEPRPGGAAFTEDGTNFTFIPEGTNVSMNFWGFGYGMMQETKRYFSRFLAENLPTNPLKCEYYIALPLNALLEEKKVEIRVLPTTEKWHGVTYAEDMPKVLAAIADMKANGTYPKFLWKE